MLLADYMVHVLDSVQIPWCINTIDKFYDYEQNQWIDSMKTLRDTIDGNKDDPVTLVSGSHRTSLNPVKVVGNTIQFCSEGIRHIELFGMNGRTFFSQSVDGREFTIPSPLSGFMIARISMGGVEQIVRISQ